MRYAIFLFIILLFTACTSMPKDVKKVEYVPEIYPDYVGVTIPVGIAPMNFDIIEGDFERVDVVVRGSKGGEMHVQGKRINFNIGDWHALTEMNRGGRLTFLVCVKREKEWTQFKEFDMFVGEDDLNDWGLTYRRIAPGYEVYGHMGIYQRDLSTFEETAIVDNTLLPGACFNCHTTNRTSPLQFTFHVRGEHGATFIHHDGENEVLQAVNDSIGGALVYPYWHPSGLYCTYSTNTTRQGFHIMGDERLEVFDQTSDVLIYEPQTHTILRDTLVATQSHFETYPVFSPDGKTLYFCSSIAVPMPQSYQEVKYNICRVEFDTESGCFVSEVDTIFNARQLGKSAIHPRPSYDGRYVMFTLADYGCFPIWHKEADNWLLDLQTLEARPLTSANSEDTDSWHNWSQDSHWFVFTSRRDDGLYTRLYICSIDKNGNATKPFLLPQKSPKAYYDNMLYSYNTPDFASEPIRLDKHEVSKDLLSPKRVATKVKNTNTK